MYLCLNMSIDSASHPSEEYKLLNTVAHAMHCSEFEAAEQSASTHISEVSARLQLFFSDANAGRVPP